ncbi:MULTISPECIES: type II toxin-antitoxin system VapC family toxin [unclassified Aureimonas]|uniref:type II toxin-antitoxin system VapC family toxin n=1 Tax=unclassified Aureimonas TaxID=2615206 RepID=UPI0006FA8716|nr:MULTISPECIES: type II toxin-antitoxin system VapC family toxin [unclassified Aureimonas]KQT64285.1 twitching motility protein PilT [Aureimonas sp. Leaf427]KQT81474.1 twitching motility protein PilT [Aureimonas sp. Leaf460]
MTLFLDASAIVGIIAKEDDWKSLNQKYALHARRFTSPLAIWEAVTALVRIQAISFERAESMVHRFLESGNAQILPVTAEIGALAVEASRRYGRGRHKADLNFGDCFAYACARHHDLSLLFKGDDFVHTDIEAA